MAGGSGEHHALASRFGTKFGNRVPRGGRRHSPDQRFWIAGTARGRDGLRHRCPGHPPGEGLPPQQPRRLARPARSMPRRRVRVARRHRGPHRRRHLRRHPRSRRPLSPSLSSPAVRSQRGFARTLAGGSLRMVAAHADPDRRPEKASRLADISWVRTVRYVAHGSVEPFGSCFGVKNVPASRTCFHSALSCFRSTCRVCQRRGFSGSAASAQCGSAPGVPNRSNNVRTMGNRRSLTAGA